MKRGGLVGAKALVSLALLAYLLSTAFRKLILRLTAALRGNGKD